MEETTGKPQSILFFVVKSLNRTTTMLLCRISTKIVSKVQAFSKKSQNQLILNIITCIYLCLHGLYLGTTRALRGYYLGRLGDFSIQDPQEICAFFCANFCGNICKVQKFAQKIAKAFACRLFFGFYLCKYVHKFLGFKNICANFCSIICTNFSVTKIFAQIFAQLFAQIFGLKQI